MDLLPLARLLFVAIFATALSIPAIPGVGLAQPAAGRYPPGRPEARLIERHAEQLGLDEETVAAVKKLADESREADQKAVEETRKAWERMRELLDQELPDEKALLEQAVAISRASGEAHKRRLLTTLRVRSLLTPDQRAKFMELRKQARPPRPGGPRQAERPRPEKPQPEQ
jgi:Spy/CpxP family protein refolding chaperone